jgi:DNA repair protein RecO (recombination protein O)
MATQRIADEPAYVLHRYDWSETSLILEVFTRHHGRVALVAKGAKRPTSSFRPVLLPLQPLSLAFGGDGEIRTLKSAEWVGGHVMPTGEALLSGYYLNELLMRLTARDDPHLLVFDVYAAAVRLLASGDPDALQWALRGFELVLLKEMGLLPALDVQTLTLAPLSPTDCYTLVPEAGLQWVPDDRLRNALRGEQWQALHAALNASNPLAALLRGCADLLGTLQRPLRLLLNYHCGVGALRTRQMMLDLQTL